MDHDADEDIAQFEQFMFDQEMSSKFAAQRTEDDLDEEEEEPPEDVFSEKDEEEKEKKVEQVKPIVANENRPRLISSIPSSSSSGKENGKPYSDYFLKFPILRQKSMTITLSNGQRRFYAVNDPKKDVSYRPSLSSAKGQLKSPFDSKQFLKIESEVEVKIAVERKVAEARSMANKSDISMSETFSGVTPTTTTTATGVTKAPLVKKFAPNRFIDLLSHEKRNRDALKWLRSFDKPIPQPTDGQQLQAPPIVPKILLLAGPPGSGKTTLCHVLARHAGYRAVEINASDERSVQGLTEKIQSATEMKSVFDENGKFNLVILDEIDGISDGVQAVVQYATSTKTVRPIICTCNDAYAPSLRPLRRIALVMTVNLPSRSRLVKRLREVCQYEQIDHRPGALELLCTRMGDDIRASLNALDFWKRSACSVPPRKQSAEYMEEEEIEEENANRLVLDVGAVHKLPAFAKDGTADLWSTWRMILQRKHNGELLPILSRHMGDLDVVVDGIHENFLRNKFMDPSFTKTYKACEWLSFIDVVQTKIAKEQDYSFISYCAAGCAGVGKTVNHGSSPGKMIFPLNAGSFRAQKMKNEDAIGELLQHPRVSRTFAKREIATDVVPALLALIVPYVRPIPPQALSPPEKVEFERVVSLLQEFDLTWVESADFQIGQRFGSQTSNKSNIQWNLDPPIDRVATFHGERSVGVILSEHARALIARLKKSPKDMDNGFRRLAVSSKSQQSSQLAKTSTGSKEASQDSDSHEKATTSSGEQNKRIRLATAHPVSVSVKPAEVPSAPGVKRDFFGRIITSQAATVVMNKNSSKNGVGGADIPLLTNKPQHEFTFRFNEGLTDAVRRVVKMQELM
jgi:chromosome transmission fidelity protein 18